MKDGNGLVRVMGPVADVGKAQETQVPQLLGGQSDGVPQADEGLWHVADHPPIVSGEKVC